MTRSPGGNHRVRLIIFLRASAVICVIFSLVVAQSDLRLALVYCVTPEKLWNHAALFVA